MSGPLSSRKHDPVPPGALVLSLDFELHWGVRDHQGAAGSYRPALLRARGAVASTLALFEAYGVAATWATVGFLFARTREEMKAHCPAARPAYEDARLDAYRETVGASEADDPVHFAPSLVERIRRTPRQELATHTFSHYYCGEPGASPDTFRADLQAAKRIAEARGVALRSAVFPRNQAGPAYVRVLAEEGLGVYRGNPLGWLWRVEVGAAGRRPLRRVGRFLDAYLPLGGDDTVGWDDLLGEGGAVNVRASRFLRPYDPRLVALEPLRFQRIARGIERAAREGRIYHLWWHPHNFGRHTEPNLAFLRRVLDAYAKARERYGMRSLTMGEAADLARSRNGLAAHPALSQGMTG